MDYERLLVVCFKDFGELGSESFFLFVDFGLLGFDFGNEVRLEVLDGFKVLSFGVIDYMISFRL